MPGDIFSVFNSNRPTPAGPPTPAVNPTDPNTATANNSVTLPTNNTTVTNSNLDPNTVTPIPPVVETSVAPAPPVASNTVAPTPTAQDNATNSVTPQNSGTPIAQGDTPNNNAFNPASDANPAGPVEPNSDVPPKQLNAEVNKQIGDPDVQPEQATMPPNDAPSPFADTLSKLQTVGGLVGAAASALARQQIPQPIQDAFNAFNKFLESPADPGLVDFADRQNGAVVGLAEGLGLLPNLQIADSGSIDGFSSTEESLNNNPSQAFQESRQINNVIGFGLPFVLEGGGAGKPPASSPELVPVGPGVGVGTPVENPAPLVRTLGTGPLETRVDNNQNNQGPLQSRNEDTNGNIAGGAGDTPQGNNNRGTFAPRSSATQGSIDETSKIFDPNEKRVAEILKGEGYDVKALPESNNGGRNADSLVTDLQTGQQTRVEFKALEGLKVNGESSDSNSVVRSVQASLEREGQARNIIFNARGSGLTEEEALRSFRRIGGVENGKLDDLRIVGDGFDISTEYPFKP